VTRISKQGYVKTAKSINETDDGYLQQLPLDAPVLILQGRQDLIRETNTVLVERFPQAENVWIEDANHYLWLEKPDSFRETLVNFYSELEGSHD
jgi:pimeloyl-ACP methyl ester carboxylesterase